jgi:carboxypeptidase Taq
MTRSAREAYTALIARVREAALLESCGSVLSWDESTYMPRRGTGHRSEQMALLARLGHEMRTHPLVGELLGEIENSDLVRDSHADEAVNVREIRRVYDRAVKVPVALVEELARVSTLAQQVWRDARRESRFSPFQPMLEKIVRLLREKAQAIGYTRVPYDALMDEYEPGATTAEISQLFTRLRAELAPLVSAIAGSGQKPRTEILERDYPVERQRLLAESAAAAIGFDFEAGRLDESAHPFCSGFGPGDCRLTTRYNAHHFTESFFGVLHEAGHGMYEQGLPAEHFGTPVGSFCSLGIHESQSRLWENQVGRSQAFQDYFFPRIRQTFPTTLAGVSVDDWLLAINDVRPSFIRVEADEATYNLHIILRFEVEQALISGDLAVADVPAVWNEKFRSLLGGLEVPDDARGCLQDIHWSFGGLGYFPTYTLGNLYAAQFMNAARRDLPGLEADFRQGEFGRLKGWLNQKIHAPGMRYRAGELCRQATGETLRHEPLMEYLRGKYTRLYRL